MGVSIEEIKSRCHSILKLMDDDPSENERPFDMMIRIETRWVEQHKQLKSVKSENKKAIQEIQSQKQEIQKLEQCLQDALESMKNVSSVTKANNRDACPRMKLLQSKLEMQMSNYEKIEAQNREYEKNLLSIE